jgi:hypothetical protein
MNLKVKPDEPYKKTISPSSLYKARCPRCTWLAYWHNFSIPVNMILSQQLSRLQEGFFEGKPTASFTSELKPGNIRLYKGKRYSKPIKVNGEESRWVFYGELDFLIEYEDGTFGVSDGKVSTKKDADLLAADYSHQLHSYAFMLENPKEGEIVKVDSLGLLQWRIEDTLPDETTLGFSVMHRYIPIERDDEKFQKFMEDMITVIEGEFPDPSPYCKECEWLTEIGYQY